MSEYEEQLTLRAAVHAALGEPARLAIVDELAVSDRSPKELAVRLDIPSNLLAHHLDVLEQVGLIARSSSSGDGRRKYVRLLHPTVALEATGRAPGGKMLFLCSHNSARSQLAAAIWTGANWPRRIVGRHTTCATSASGRSRCGTPCRDLARWCHPDPDRFDPDYFPGGDRVRPGARRVGSSAGMVALVDCRPGRDWLAGSVRCSRRRARCRESRE